MYNVIILLNKHEFNLKIFSNYNHEIAPDGVQSPL